MEILPKLKFTEVKLLELGTMCIQTRFILAEFRDGEESKRQCGTIIYIDPAILLLK